MSLGKNQKPIKSQLGKWSIFGKGTNTSNPHNSSHQEDTPTDFNLSTITLEDIDQGVFQEFHNRFVIDDRNMALFSGDAETTSLPMMNYEQYDQEKGFLNWPFFVYTRTESNKILRTNPSYKQVIYATPKKKAQGIVIEEYITEGPINYELIYEFKFITYFREEANAMEQQMNYYFRNKRNIIVVGKERFSIGPAQNPLCTIDLVSRNEAAQITMYVLNFKLKLWCWTRDLLTMQKRERPNSYSFNFVVKDGSPEAQTSRIVSKESINLEQYVVTNKTGPDELIDPT